MNKNKKLNSSKDIKINLILSDRGYTAITASGRVEYDDKGNKRVAIGNLDEAPTIISIIDRRTPPPTCPFKRNVKKVKVWFNRFK
ncbi:hypothetical protein AXW38_07165 [Yersinia ruckeri]|uniref:hypothetical protein n=1 Tax=Yersinia ruckeri TaxID=29486 RepID=UPI0004E2EDDE|nr:hypothetical protein [Yersinia ruckeri]ARZ00761.1 hypothetical protein QMA0440_01421 [Yersinia ruckeri]KFE38707.1 hypothetical protein nADLYRO1b_1972 [Yersinia ruckeri]OIX31127.1 hypothetical protein AXW19_07150 [Yersinia ruckeri]OIX31266.1 hypothetical protein AXW20_07160 [Yersinia ruckeri]OIX40539.1 hypothetical protein AXW18_07155 [Yersinia ruckeri]